MQQGLLTALFIRAVNAAEAVLADETAAQEKVDAALKALEEAVKALEIDGLGDVDGDKVITSNDAALAYIMAYDPNGSQDAKAIARADVDKNGEVTVSDAQKILQKVLRASIDF